MEEQIMSDIKYYVPSIHCGHCVHTIQMELGDLEGIKSVQADMFTKHVSVVYDTPATPEKIEQLLADINYPVLK
jgi:copper chaperone